MHRKYQRGRLMYHSLTHPTRAFLSLQSSTEICRFPAAVQDQQFSRDDAACRESKRFGGGQSRSSYAGLATMIVVAVALAENG